MAKTSGGTRRYRKGTNAYENRRSAFDELMKTGNYDAANSKFYKGGGFYVTHKDHNKEGIDKDGKKVDLTQKATRNAARHGYRVILGEEKSSRLGEKKADGSFEYKKMDVKTISTAGRYTLKNAVRKAAMQGSEIVLIQQNTKTMTRAWVESQLNEFRKHQPKGFEGVVKKVVICSMDGKRIHRHNI